VQNKKLNKVKILLTNDDGIHAEGLHSLYKELKKIADVYITAPDSERSAAGHAITVSKPIFHKKIYNKKKFFGYATSGTPADCVKLAMKVLNKNKPNMIISGINLGPNDGCSIFYSGTVAGAREGALYGIPSIAFSLATFSNPNFAFAAKTAVNITKIIRKKEIPHGTFLNINIPNLDPIKIKGIKITHQGLLPIHTEFIKNKDPLKNQYYWMTGNSPQNGKKTNSDTSELNNGYITITPIKIDSTHHVFIDDLKKWKF